jgi:hypothetical protein
MPYRITCMQHQLKTHSDDISIYNEDSDEYVYRVCELDVYEVNSLSGIASVVHRVKHICHYRWSDGQVCVNG